MLVVEDNKVNVLVARACWASGLQVVVARRCGSAGATMRRPEHADGCMPVMDGLAATAAIRAGDAGTGCSGRADYRATADAAGRDRATCLAIGGLSKAGATYD